MNLQHAPAVPKAMRVGREIEWILTASSWNRRLHASAVAVCESFINSFLKFFVSLGIETYFRWHREGEEAFKVFSSKLAMKRFTFRSKELFMMLSLQSVRHSNGDQELKVNKKRTRIQINFLLIAQFKQLFFYRRRPDWDKLSQRGKLIEKENASQLHCENNRLGKKHF